ncbi:MAG: pyridoxine 5'-phosphate synthase [Elusimicrobia bacterium RIFOXYA2_FULL_39_19]|nr:MAG: pyridoxine 5'-phosphate synthase [Elusimicrobia bacterium RIFOXYA2_FULL_39_19]
MVKLGVNIDHIATLRQARKDGYPEPVVAAGICEIHGADGITVHLREDRRHINDTDVYLLRKILRIPLNLEMSIADEIVRVALSIVPDEVCIVPEKRQELTTEGGLNVISQKSKIQKVVTKLKSKGIAVSLFIDPELEQVKASKDAGADSIELHTGRYAQMKKQSDKNRELAKLIQAGHAACTLRLTLNAGHGLDYTNVVPVAKIPNMNALNIGFSIVARSVFTGLGNAVSEMKKTISI